MKFKTIYDKLGANWEEISDPIADVVWTKIRREVGAGHIRSVVWNAFNPPAHLRLGVDVALALLIEQL